MDKVRPAREDIKSPPCTTSKNSLAIRHCMCRYIFMYEGLDGGSWYSLITKKLAIYSLSLNFWLIH